MKVKAFFAVDCEDGNLPFRQRRSSVATHPQRTPRWLRTSAWWLGLNRVEGALAAGPQTVAPSRRSTGSANGFLFSVPGQMEGLC
jgi:hypothetical protein